jgi:hypothetical protein
MRYSSQTLVAKISRRARHVVLGIVEIGLKVGICTSLLRLDESGMLPIPLDSLLF